MLSRQVIDHTLENIPGYAGKELTIKTIEKGGSGRKFYRVSKPDGDALIVVHYSNHREENLHYVDIAHFLSRAGIRVPQIVFHDAAQGLIGMEDLGGVDLWSQRESSWKNRGPLYEASLREVAKLHALDPSPENLSGLTLQPVFDENLYRWEQNYFFEYCLGIHFGIPETHLRRLAAIPVWRDLAQSLAARPRVLVHRDFQSQNILLQGNRAALIDFQGMRPGLAAYDLASLLYDPYVNLTAVEREALKGCYQREAERLGRPVAPDFDELFYQCALQRLMQALGAYGFLGKHEGRPEFLTHIPAARQSLREVLEHLEGLDELAATLDALPEVRG